MEWFWCRYGFILTLSVFIQILFILRLATMNPCKSDTPYLSIIKGKLGHKPYERECWFLFTYIVLMQIQSDLYLAETNITFKQQYTFKFYKYTFKQQQAQATKYFEVQATKYDKLSLQVQYPVQSVAFFKLFFVDAINGTFLYLFLLASLEQQ